jgi:hypothetical protein
MRHAAADPHVDREDRLAWSRLPFIDTPLETTIARATPAIRGDA